MNAETDRLSRWLLGSMELDTAVLHVGQYCGHWRASTAGRAMGSFHLVLDGQCYLHLEGAAPIVLGPRDGVFLLRDLPHFLSPHRDAAQAVAAQPMQPVPGPCTTMASDATALACGFFEFRTPLSSLIIDSFPPYLLLRGDAPAFGAAASLFELILQEAGGDPEQPSPLIARLVELLFFYLIRHVAQGEQVAAGLLPLLHRPEFSPLLERMLAAPGDDWSIENMARAACMSRASFCKHFASVSGHTPAQFLLLLRMKLAARRLHDGASVERAAELVGYRSHAAFTRAFKRVTGEQPGAYRRDQRLRQLPN